MLVTILVFLLMLSVLVLIHEAGHFFAAKKFGVKVEEFGFGFPPRAFSIKKGETIYSVNWLPIGGFVKLYGEDEAGGGKLSIENPEKKVATNDRHRAFFVKPVWQRGIIVVMGVVMNFLLAVCILSYLFASQGVPTPTSGVEIAAVIKNSPAERGGLHIGDVVLKINSTTVHTPNELISLTKKNLGKQLTLIVKNKKGDTKKILITPRVTYPKNEGAMGVAITPAVLIRKYPWYQAPLVGTKEAFVESGMIIVGLKDAIGTLIMHQQVPKGLAGPVGIAELTGQFVQVGPYAVLSLVALLSLNLAVLNILPIPALDGGRLFFILIEAVTRKKIHPKFEAYAHTVGMILLLSLIVAITLHDVTRLVSGQPLLPKP